MNVHYNVIKDPRVGDGPSRLIGRFETRAEANALVREELEKAENQIWLYRISRQESEPDQNGTDAT